MRTLHTIIFILLILSLSSIHAQDKFVGIHGGMSLYSGDLNPQPASKIINNARSEYGAFFRQDINDRFSAQLSLSIANLTAADSLSTLNSERYNRNLSFKNQINELALMLQWNALKISKSTGYLTAGFAGFRHNPKATDPNSGQLVNLQILGTEGQGPGSENLGERYSLFNFAIPYGIGFRTELTEQVTIGIELLGRYTFTDYIDDVSSNQYLPFLQLESLNGRQAAALADPSRLGADSPSRNPNSTITRGNPNNRDQYFTASITVAYKLPDLNGKGIDCYSF